MAIYHHEPRDGFPECYSISSGGCYLPGLYATRGAAQHAFGVSDALLWAMQERIVKSEARPITIDDIRKAVRDAT